MMRGLICISVMAFTLAGCVEPMCGNDLIAETQSPDGKHIASVFERSCGATTPYIRVVSLRKANEKFEPEEHEDWVFTVHAQVAVAAHWDDSSKLRVISEETEDTPTQRSNWQNIEIVFDKKPSNN